MILTILSLFCSYIYNRFRENFNYAYNNTIIVLIYFVERFYLFEIIFLPSHSSKTLEPSVKTLHFH